MTASLNHSDQSTKSESPNPCLGTPLEDDRPDHPFVSAKQKCFHQPSSGPFGDFNPRLALALPMARAVVKIQLLLVLVAKVQLVSF